MSIFKYCEKIVDLPANLKASSGDGVKIAIFDTGANLTSDGMSHLDVLGRKFDVTTSDFDPMTAEGNDSVDDENGHGTNLLSILGGKPVSTDKGVVGIAPDAEIFIIKIADLQGKINDQYLINALILANRLDVDIVTNSSFPNLKKFSNIKVMKEELKKMEAKKILFISALKNRNTAKALNNLNHVPINFDYTLPVGVARDVMVNKLTQSFKFKNQIAFLIPEVDVKFYEKDIVADVSNTKITSSHSSAILAGLFALILSEKRNSDAGFTRFSKEELIAELATFCPTLSKANLGAKSFQFYYNKSVSV